MNATKVKQNSPDTQTLLENHLVFLTSHRGKVDKQEDTILINSDHEEFSYLIAGPETDPGAYLDRYRQVHVGRQASHPKAVLEKLGWVSDSSLAYMSMSLDPQAAPWPVCESVEVQRARSTEELDTFSELQSRGFLESEDSYRSWHPWLRAANHRNLPDQNQHFLIGRLHGEPAGVLLMIVCGDLAGIYAVATLPAFRNNGVSTSLLGHAVQQAGAEGCQALTLQVHRGSYAESFYRKLGFLTAFEMDIFTPADTP